MARGIDAKSTADEFLVRSNEELAHADRLAERIVQLGGEPDLSPDTLSTRSHTEYVAGQSLVDMIREDLVAERIAIDSYREVIAYLGDKDSTSSQMLKEILAVEEQHADELADLLQDLPACARALALMGVSRELVAGLCPGFRLKASIYWRCSHLTSRSICAVTYTVTRQMVLPTSSATSNAPCWSMATPTGRPNARPLALRNPLSTSTGLPLGCPAVCAPSA
jgi:bacterioferritin (cytochrome b1)